MGTTVDRPRVLTLKGLARILGIQNPRAAKRLVQREGIPTVRLGRRTYILEASLLEFLKSRERTPDGRQLIDVVRRLDGERKAAATATVARLTGR